MQAVSFRGVKNRTEAAVELAYGPKLCQIRVFHHPSVHKYRLWKDSLRQKRTKPNRTRTQSVRSVVDRSPVAPDPGVQDGAMIVS